ncbi:MAG: transcription-repair coupling factor [Clostridiales bacterium]|jgi:transcription-repair coupling factor (superfamily II helicase)|nr:transcription-repair coupling factor [Eubacteriales bacterium]MDH7567035.1 transcription-repair coupling factor [Clostridiales bacterium]
MNFLTDPLLEIKEYNQILNFIKTGNTPVGIEGPSDSQKAHIAYGLCQHLKRRGIFIAFNEIQARKMYEDFSFFFGDDVLLYSSKEVMLYDIEAKSYEAVFQRLNALDRIVEGKYRFIVTSIEAAAQKLIPKDEFSGCILNFTLDGTADLTAVAQSLTAMGYERVDTVEGMGQFAVRGGIIDIFPVNSEFALRMELFGDEIDSIRRFDIMTQRSVDRLENVRVIPAREVIYPVEKRDAIIRHIKNDLGEYIEKIRGRSRPERIRQVREKVEADVERLENDYYFPGIDRYIPYIIDRPVGITDYVDKDVLVFLDESARQRQRLETMSQEHLETCKSLMEKGHLLPGSMDLFFKPEDIKDSLHARKTVYLSTLHSDVKALDGGVSFNIASKLLGSYQGHMELLTEEIKNWKKNRSRVLVLSGTKSRGERLVESFRSSGLESVYVEDEKFQLHPGQVAVTRGSLNKGFEYPAAGFVVISDKEAFGGNRRPRRLHTGNKGAKINLFTDLNPGDYVVHQAHGIGQYVGIEKLAVDTVKRDYLKIRYQEGDYLYIPTNQLDLIQKYIGAEGKQPRLNKLGGSDWAKTKKRVKESLKELAGELVDLYAKRRSLQGHAFSRDTVWQRQLEELFPFEETEDQLRCIDEVKADMERPMPMDRLLCGDVGCGKTEVALRAVFKAVMDGKQVAYLVPTTILAQQQYNTFKERMKDFPVTVDVISRFRSPAEQKSILKGVKAGTVDVLIGTHRLLQKDVRFKDLGLLVVDEEQRFGVTHKERLKNINPQVDVLTITATPIPRTLHMSLVGIRDISVIEESPEERYPVQTYVMEFDSDVIRDAINREMGRSGQVFYLSNRVRSIHKKAADLQALVPDARIAVAHGQMDERQLEDVMSAFISGEFDILVCTTIIESGLDMPNVNTIIVEDADKMGLAQLHQLRGRVGRSNRLAYAYITYKKDKVLSEVAEKRLQAIKEFTELGSGFKIAMRDLEIRGAGNLLGPEQHGHIESVGYDMYCKLLDEAVRELKGEKICDTEDEIIIDLNVSAYIDDSYIRTETRKIEMYKKIASIQDVQDAMDIQDELVDRYGDLPEAVRNLITIAYIKAMAAELGFSSVTEKNGSVILHLKKGKNLDIGAIGKLSAKYKRQLLFNAGTSPYLMYRPIGTDRNNLLENVKILLQDVKSFTV